jgi:hypothetical protein
MHPYWLLVEPLGFALLVMPKCGANTVWAAIARRLGYDITIPARIHEAVPGCRFVMTTTVRERTDIMRYCITRDPVDRIASLWKNKCRDRTNGIPKELYGATPDQLLKHIARARFANHHWMPQATIEAGIADKLIPIECFAQWWDDPIEKWNVTSGDVEVDSTKVLALYADDAALHRRSLESYNGETLYA